jgi:di/tricarboxylate transporter
MTINPILATYIIIAAALLLILSDRVRPDLIAILTAISLGLTGVLTPQETFSGFSRSAVITILAIFVLAEGLQRTGVTDLVGDALLKISGAREGWMVFFIVFAGAGLSLFMNNIAAAVVLLPAVTGVTRKTGISPSRLMMPLAFGTILGGMATLFTTTNIVVSSLLRDHDIAGFGVFDFLPLGIPIVLTGGLYLVFGGRRLLKSKANLLVSETVALTETNLSDIYQLDERLFWVKIPANSPLVNQPLRLSHLRDSYRFHVLAVQHQLQTNFVPGPETILKAGDLLWVAAHPDDIQQDKLKEIVQFPVIPNHNNTHLEGQDFAMVEAILAPRSRLIGQTLSSSHFREKYGMEVIAIWRSGRPYRTRLSELTLQFGDALLLYGKRSQVVVLHAESDFVLLGEPKDSSSPARGIKTWIALGLLILAVVLAGFNNAIVGEVMLGAAVLMVISGILSMDQVYQAVEWKSIFLIAGMLPLGIALTKTGVATTLGASMVDLLGGLGPVAMLAGLVIVTMLLSQAVHGAVVAAIITPIAIQIALDLGINPRALCMGVALATSLAFLTPLGHPVNILIMGPGGYHFRDYFRVGAPLTAILLVLIIFLLPLVWKLT